MHHDRYFCQFLIFNLVSCLETSYYTVCFHVELLAFLKHKIYFGALTFTCASLSTLPRRVLMVCLYFMLHTLSI